MKRIIYFFTIKNKLVILLSKTFRQPTYDDINKLLPKNRMLAGHKILSSIEYRKLHNYLSTIPILENKKS